jgi:hypothetical protein
MPYQANGVRNYREQYDKYDGKPEQVKDRAKRNAARAMLAKEGVVKKGDGKDVDHKKALSKGGGNARGNQIGRASCRERV